MKALLDQCVRRQWYGDEAATIRHFINAGIERLLDQNRLVDEPTAVNIPASHVSAAKGRFDFPNIAKNAIIVLTLADWDRDEPMPGFGFDEIYKGVFVAGIAKRPGFLTRIFGKEWLGGDCGVHEFI
jgi:hypothetical protein